MSIGTLALRVVPDAPTDYFYGNSRPVTGKVAITFEPSKKLASQTSTELFGPLQVQICLHGRAKTKLWKRTGNSTHVYRGRAPLFATSKTIYDSPFKSQPLETNFVPFEIYFPDRIHTDAYNGWDPDARYAPEEALPPSFSESYHGFSGRYETFVEYRIGVTAYMQGLKVDISVPSKEVEPLVLYERPRVTLPSHEIMSQGTGVVSVSNEFLVPEGNRPSGMMEKMKSAFKSDYFPTYIFDWKCVGPACIYLHRPVSYRVTIVPRPPSTPTCIIPEVTLSSFTIEIKASTIVRADRQLFSHPQSSGTHTIASMRGITNKEPFSKANEWTRIVKAGRFTGLPSTFSTANIRRTYSIVVKLVFSLAGKDKDFAQSFNLVIAPPVASSDAEAGAASSSAAGVTLAPPLEINGEPYVLPAYEGPPEYHEDLKT